MKRATGGDSNTFRPRSSTFWPTVVSLPWGSGSLTDGLAGINHCIPFFFAQYFSIAPQAIEVVLIGWSLIFSRKSILGEVWRCSYSCSEEP